MTLEVLLADASGFEAVGDLAALDVRGYDVTVTADLVDIKGHLGTRY